MTTRCLKRLDLFRRRDGRWVVTHGHESVPWDPETGQGVLTLAEGPEAP